MKAQQLRLTVLAAAVSAAFAGTASAAEVGVYFGAGATAPVNGLRAAILTNANLCGAPTTGTSITFYEIGPKPLGGAIWAIQCTNATGALAINYDSNGGSWKGLGVYPALYAAAQADPTASSNNHYNWLIPATGAATAVPGGCTLANSATVDSYSGATVTDYTGCTSVSATGNPTFGFTDVEKSIFWGAIQNQPVPTANTATFVNGQAGLDPNFVIDTTGNELAGYPKVVFGVVFGVGASSALYNAMQVDQANPAVGLLPSSCAPGGVATGVSAYPGVCAPIITTSMYRSAVQEKLNAFNTTPSVQELFFNPPPPAISNAAFTVSRRDQGSGTQATSNFTFFHVGCGTPSQEAPDLVPAVPSDSFAPNYTVEYRFATGDVQTDLTTPPVVNANGGVVLAVLTDEKDTATGLGGGSGFLKLDGLYPSEINAALGRYNMVSDENMHAATTANVNLVTAIQTAVLAYSNQGIVNMNTQAVAWPALGAGFKGHPSNSYYNNLIGMCGGWRSY